MIKTKKQDALKGLMLVLMFCLGFIASDLINTINNSPTEDCIYCPPPLTQIQPIHAMLLHQNHIVGNMVFSDCGFCMVDFASDSNIDYECSNYEKYEQE